MPSLLSPKFDSFRFKIPEYLFNPELIKKYSQIYSQEKTLITDPVEFLNQTVVAISFLGMGDGIVIQEQTATGNQMLHTGNKIIDNQSYIKNKFHHPSAEQYYRSARNPLSMVDKTFTITFRHTLGFWNYFFMFEAFFYQTLRDTESNSDQLKTSFNVEILNSPAGEVISKVVIKEPVIEQIDALDLSYQKVRPESQTFLVKFRFNNIDYQFITPDKED